MIRLSAERRHKQAALITGFKNKHLTELYLAFTNYPSKQQNFSLLITINFSVTGLRLGLSIADKYRTENRRIT